LVNLVFLLVFGLGLGAGLELSLDSPLNEIYNISNIDLNVSSDSNETLTWVWSNDSFTTNHSFTPNITINWSEGQHILHVGANDTSGNFNSTSVVFSVDLPPEITINFPENSEYNYSNFSLDVSANENISNWIWSSDSGETNHTFALDDSFIFDGRVNLSVWGKDAGGNWGGASVVFVANDTTAPSVSLSSPSDGSSQDEDTDVNFEFNVDEDNTITKCVLTVLDDSGEVAVEGTLDENDVDKSATNIINKKMSSPGDYSWFINCTDLAGNTGNSEIFDLRIDEVSSEGGEGGSSSSSDEGSSSEDFFESTTEEAVYFVTNYNMEKGYSMVIEEGDEVRFNTNISDEMETHSLYLNEVLFDSINVTVSSNLSINRIVNLSEVEKFDLNEDSYYDLRLELYGVAGDEANISLKTIDEFYEMKEENTESNKSESGKGTLSKITGGFINTLNEIKEFGKKKLGIESFKDKKIIILLPVALVAGFVVALVVRWGVRKKKKKNESLEEKRKELASFYKEAEKIPFD